MNMIGFLDIKQTYNVLEDLGQINQGDSFYLGGA